MNTPLKVIFAGTPDFAARHLDALLASEHDVIAVYSQPDRPAGRGKKLQASAVKQLAVEHHVPVYQPQNLRDTDAQATLAALNADIMIVVAYGLILPTEVLNAPRYGCLNVHGSLLPKWRGAAPIQRSIWAGDKQTGVTIMQMDEGLDTGDMLLKRSVDIAQQDTSASLYERLAKLGPQALIETLAQLPSLVPEKQQDSASTYAQKLSKQEARIDWTLTASQLERNVRAFNPWPVSHFEVEGSLIKVWQASVVDEHTNTVGEIIRADKQGILISTGEKGLLLEKIQLPGKKAMAAADVLNAKKDWFKVGKVLGG